MSKLSEKRAVNGKGLEALALLPALAKELGGKDQMIPNYQNFTTWLLRKYANSSEE